MLHQDLCIISNSSVNSNWSYSPEALNSGKNWIFFVPCDLEILWMTLQTIGHLFYTLSSFVHHFKTVVEFNWSYSPETLNSGQNQQFFVPCDLEIWRKTLKNNMAPLLCCFKLYASFDSHHLIETWVTVWKHPIWVKIDVFVPCDLKI